MQTNDIVKDERGKYRLPAPNVNTVPTILSGHYLTMRDGSRWFHADNGKGPFQIDPPTKGTPNVYT